MKYILIITAAFLFGCGSKEADQQAQTQQILKNNREATKALLPLMQERDRKIKYFVSKGKEEEAAAAGREFIRQRDSIMRINY